MEQYTGTPVHLQNFTVTHTYSRKRRGVRTFFISGHLNEEVHPKHMAVADFQIVVEVQYTRWECQVCHACFRVQIPFREMYPHVKIVCDGFHLIKNYNDMVLTEIRIAGQRRLREGMEPAIRKGDKQLYKELYNEYKFFKGSRYLILSSKKTLELKDAASCEHNRLLYEKYEKRGLELPIGKHYLPARSIERLNEVLNANENCRQPTISERCLNLHCNAQTHQSLTGISKGGCLWQREPATMNFSDSPDDSHHFWARADIHQHYSNVQSINRPLTS